MQTAKQSAPVPVTVRSDPSDDGTQARVGYRVLPQGQHPKIGPAETDEQFLRRFNRALCIQDDEDRTKKLPALQGLGTEGEGYRIRALRWMIPYEYFAELCLEVITPTRQVINVIVEVHTAGDRHRACVVIPFVRTPDGPHVCIVRENRYTLFFNEREMRLERRALTGEPRNPRSGWINAWARGFSVSASTAAIADARLASVPFSVPYDKRRWAQGARSVASRKLGSLFLPRRQGGGAVLPPIARAVRGTFLDEMPENTGRSATWIGVFALEVRIDDPADYQRYIVDRGRFGPDPVRGRFVPFKELTTFAGRHAHDFIDAFSIAGRGLFAEALEDGRVKAQGKSSSLKLVVS